ncbi:unnamed protein product, partial [Rotaria magnacalcarata]
LLRELYDYQHRNPNRYPQYVADSISYPHSLKKLYAQRTRLNDDNEDTAENMS